MGLAMGKAPDLLRVKKLYKDVTGKEHPSDNTVTIFEDLFDFYDRIISQMPGSIYWKGLDGKYLGCNENTAKLAGLSRSELHGLADKDLFELGKIEYETVKLLEEDDKNVMLDNEPIINRIEEIQSASEKSNRVLITNKLPLKDGDNNTIAVLGISLDITKEKEYEAQLKNALKRAKAADEAKAYFLRACGHELRTPLANIVNPVEILKDDRDDPFLSDEERDHYLEMIGDQAEHLEHLIEDIISYVVSKGQEQTKVCSKPMNIKKLLEKMYQTYKLKVVGPVLLKFSFPDDVPEEVLGDSIRVKQVIANLLNNAMKFTEDGYISIDAKVDQDNPSHIRVSVTDTGLGIATEKLPTIWDVGVQAHSENDDQRMGRYRGLGIGLALIKEMVEKMNGNVGAESELGKGSVFYFTLPLAS